MVPDAVFESVMAQSLEWQLPYLGAHLSEILSVQRGSPSGISEGIFPIPVLEKELLGEYLVRSVKV